MTKKLAKVELCADCRHDFGWHYSDDLVPVATRPHHDQAKQLAEAHLLSAAANEAAMQAGRLIIRDYAATHDRFTANDTRHLFDLAQIPDPVTGAVYLWAAGKGATADGPLIRNTGEARPSTEGTTRHKIAVWESCVYVARRVAS